MTPGELLAALADARDRPDDAAKVAELDRIVGYADAAGDLRLGVTARLALIEVHQQVDPGRMLLPVQWCLGAADRAPGTLDSADVDRLHRYHQEAVAAVCATSRLGLARAGAALDDLERRLGSAGQSRRPAYALRCRIADHIGAESTARRWLARWRDAPRDGFSGCAGCEHVDQARLLVGWGRWTEAVEIVAPVLAGTVDCPEQPERALGAVQLAYLRLGRYAEAGDAHLRAYRRHRRERASFPFLADHLRFCALAGQHRRGLEILARHLPELDRPYDEASALEFAAAGALLCRLAGAAGLARGSIHRPGYAERHAADLTVAALGTELAATAADLAGRFDARNGTSHQSGRLAGWLAERPVPGPVPLPPDPPDDRPAGAVPGRVGDGRVEVVGPLTVAAIVEVLRDRADPHVHGSAGTVGGRWGGALIEFQRLGDRGEILHARVTAERRLPAYRLAEAYEFCNAWNHDKLLPKAYVQDLGAGELVLVGEVSTDLEHGVAAGQLGVLVNATLATGAAFAAAVAALP